MALDAKARAPHKRIRQWKFSCGHLHPTYCNFPLATIISGPSNLGSMPISDERIDEFINIYERACGERPSRNEARLRAGLLIELYRGLMQPFPDPELPETEPSSS